MPLHTEPDTYTSLLIHSDSVEGTQAFTDSSRHNHSFSYTGAVHHDTQTSIGCGISVFGQSSMFFDGGSDYLSVPDHSAFDFGTGDFVTWISEHDSGPEGRD